jgi:hypothetical protein
MGIDSFRVIAMLFKAFLASLFAAVVVATPTLLKRDPARPKPDARGNGSGESWTGAGSSSRSSS